MILCSCMDLTLSKEFQYFIFGVQCMGVISLLLIQNTTSAYLHGYLGKVPYLAGEGIKQEGDIWEAFHFRVMKVCIQMRKFLEKVWTLLFPVTPQSLPSNYLPFFHEKL